MVSRKVGNPCNVVSRCCGHQYIKFKLVLANNISSQTRQKNWCGTAKKQQYYKKLGITSSEHNSDQVSFVYILMYGCEYSYEASLKVCTSSKKRSCYQPITSLFTHIQAQMVFLELRKVSIQSRLIFIYIQLSHLVRMKVFYHRITAKAMFGTSCLPGICIGNVLNGSSEAIMVFTMK